ncbi:hemerythrin HHE cation binding domain protein [mine drainage metagenome]|uniref:Hemerythrin HHE cation binding domain protein n=1 Tax=mine drainage metagenome TaxID=410659 RepID=A0A1J5SQM7_9ZZZZ
MYAQTQIGTLLHEEHLHTLAALQRLEAFLSRQGNRKAPDVGDAGVRDILSHLLTDVAAEVDRHFGFEEGHLFPVLNQRGEMGIAMILTEEHRTILPLAKDLAALAASALEAGGFSPEAWRDFHDRGGELCEREMFHIQKEEMGLLAAISMFVDAADDAELAVAYRALQQ